MRMDEKVKPESIGAALARIRWAKTTDEQKREFVRKMHLGLNKYRAARRKAKKGGTK